MVIRRATLKDLETICSFTDFWLAGRGKSQGISGAVDDYFISSGQHKKYIVKYATWQCVCNSRLLCWAVVEPSGTMINMLVDGNLRGKGIGRALMAKVRPKFIRSKSDQSSGNPIGFYEKLGYRKVSRVQSRSRLDIDQVRPARRPNIDILELKR